MGGGHRLYALTYSFFYLTLTDISTFSVKPTNIAVGPLTVNKPHKAIVTLTNVTKKWAGLWELELQFGSKKRLNFSINPRSMFYRSFLNLSEALDLKERDKG